MGKSKRSSVAGRRSPDLEIAAAPYDLPAEWMWATLADVCEPVTQTNPRKTPRRGFKYVDIASIDNTRNEITEAKDYSGEEAPLRARKPIRTGDILFSTVRPDLRNIAFVPAGFSGQMASTGFCVLRAKPGLDSRYLFRYVLTNAFVQKVNDLTRGISYPAVTDRDVYSQPIPLPPVPEQERIVATIESLFAESRTARDALERVPPLLKRFRQSVLVSAFRGELTERDPQDETASVLLERIRADRRTKWARDWRAKGKDPGSAAYKEPEPPDISRLPALPVSWAWASAEQITSWITDGEHHTPKRVKTGIYLLSARNVQDGWISLEKVNRISESVYRRISARLVVDPGDILMTCSGTIGRSCVVPENLRFALVRSVAVLKPLPEMGNYLSYAIRSSVLQRQINEKKTRTAQSNIFLGKIRSLAFPIAPLAEQHRIVARIESLFAQADAIERAVAIALQRADKIDQAILARAFRGQV